MNKRVIFLIIIIVLVSFFFLIKTLTSSSLYEDIYNDDKRIVSAADSYSYKNRRGRSENRQTTLSFKLTGIETLWTLKSDYEEDISIKYSSQIEKGELKLVMIAPDNNIQTIFEGSGNGTVDLSIQEGTNRIKIVGRKAKGDVEFEILATDEMRVIPRD